MQLDVFFLLGIFLTIIGVLMLIYYFYFKFKDKKSSLFKFLGSIFGLIGIVLILVIGIGFIGTFEHSIIAKEITEELDEFYNISDEQIQSYPPLQKAIKSPSSSIETTREKYRALVSLFSNQNNTMIKYQNKFYQIAFST